MQFIQNYYDDTNEKLEQQSECELAAYIKSLSGTCNSAAAKAAFVKVLRFSRSNIYFFISILIILMPTCII